MEKIIEIDLKKEDDLYDKYNNKQISKELIEYILENTPKFNKKDKIKVIVNSDLKIETAVLIIDGLKKEYDKSLLRNERTNWLQLIYFLLGIIALFIYTLIKELIFKELLLISGWFLIWTMVELELFNDVNGRKKRKKLKKILTGEFVERNSNNL